MGKESVCNAGYASSISGLGKSPGGVSSNPLQCSCLESPLDEESGRLQSKELQRIGHDWATEHIHTK